MTAADLAGIDIFDPEQYLEAPPHEVFEHLRRTEPVYWQPMADGTGCWAVLRHADVVHVAREPTLFSASQGGVVVEDLAPERLAMMRNMLLAMDPPRHADYRRPLAPNFSRRVIAAMEDRIRTICGEILARAAEQAEVEFVDEVTSLLPSQVVGELMGLPSGDWRQIQRWADEITTGPEHDAADRDDDRGFDVADSSVRMAMYAIEFAQRRRTEPAREDLTSLILGSDFGNGPMTDVDFGSFFVQLVTAGNDTTKTMLSSGLLALLEHHEQLSELRGDRGMIPGAVEEILRWANPLHYFRRTATADTEVGGVPVRSGQKLAMVYTSANRDEAVFDEPHRFDIRRDPNPHLSFGIGEHFCLGAHLARLEGRVFFEELLETFGTIELTGEPRRARSNLTNKLSALPVRLSR